MDTRFLSVVLSDGLKPLELSVESLDIEGELKRAHQMGK